MKTEKICMRNQDRKKEKWGKNSEIFKSLKDYQR